ncbi:MAG TPA: SpoIIE family protein phosphatase [Bacteroidia bacterium]|jgi:serine phosphatase RsbU (regulator of sigma subunit)|nr:SpoIIE family protein phosphatase [Bacteroidia bacterium]
MRITVIRIFFFLIYFCFYGAAYGQYLEKRKKLEAGLRNCKEDTNKINLLNELASLTSKNNFVDSYTYSEKALVLSEELGFLKGKIDAYNNFGDAYWYHTDYIKAQGYYFKAYRINDSLKDEVGIANSLYNIGWIICLQQKNYKEVGYLYKALGVYEKLKDTDGITKVFNALGGYYGDKHSNFKKKPDFDSALMYYNKAIDFLKASGLPTRRLGIFYGNIGDLMSQLGDYKSAKFYGEKYLDLIKDSGDSASYYLNIANLAGFEMHLGNTDKAIELFEKAHLFAVRNEIKNTLALVYSGLNECYEEKGNIPKAYEFLKKTKILEDELNKQLFSANLSDFQNSYEIEKREVNIKQLKQDNEIQELKGKQNKFALAGVGIVLLIIIIIAYLLFKQNKVKNAANLLLQEQNNIIIQKKLEIDHSIQYAKGIQTALLPNINDIKKIYPESFIYYLPKDVVSGDFYWFHNVDDYFYCVAADCTGHGVPGALMSIVSMDKIIQAIFEKKLNEPKDILKFLNVEIKKALKQHTDEAKQRDGLDIALVRINTKNNSLDFASANRPLYIISNNKLSEYKADKVAIAGFTPDNHEYKQLSLKLNKGDCLYIASDGYADQFGGGNGKKFMTKNFKMLLEEGSGKDMKSQESQVISSHTSWKGKYEQVDDILVIGIKI